MNQILVTLVAVTALLTMTGVARADDPVVQPDIHIAGAQQRPSVVVMVPRAAPSRRAAEDRVSFTHEIVSSAARSPF